MSANGLPFSVKGTLPELTDPTMIVMLTGWIDASGDGELGIALRTGQISGKEIRIYAGCGIVAGSNPDKELEESNAKMIPMCSAL